MNIKKIGLTRLATVIASIATVIVIVLLVSDPPESYYNDREFFVGGEIVRMAGPDPVISYGKTIGGCILYGSIVFGIIVFGIRFGATRFIGLIKWIVGGSQRTP